MPGVGISAGEMVMGVYNEITVAGLEGDRVEGIFKEAFALLRDLDLKLSHYRPDSEISRISQMAYESPVRVSDATFEVLVKGRQFYDITRGAFDITLLPLVKLWGFYEGRPRFPDQVRLQQALARTGTAYLILNSTTKQVRLSRPGMGLDLGGIAKGYACDRVVSLLKEKQVKGALINIGGTLYGFGRRADGRPWKVGVCHPREPGAVIATLILEDLALATSGDYENYFFFEGKRYSHILDPRTGMPVQGIASVSVVAPSATEADAWSTALFVLGTQQGALVLRDYPHIQALIVEEKEGRLNRVALNGFWFA